MVTLSYLYGLPLKGDIRLTNNRPMVLKRLSSLKGRLVRDDQYRSDYSKFMEDLIGNGYAEPVPVEELTCAEGRTWYVPHHGVYHPKKPTKIHVVFDCSAEHKGETLNRHLLQAPDLTNNLTAVLCRFHQEPIAISCDIEAMFHQVGVDRSDRDLLHFLWWDSCDLDRDPREYMMTVHLFGATSSPGCANYALKATADMFEEECGRLAADFLRRNFYVDDGLKSVGDPASALQLVETSRALCQRGGFNLHKFMCNSKEVLAAIPP